MIETIAIILGSLGVLGGAGTAGYKIYKECKKDTPTIIINNQDNIKTHSPNSFRASNLEQLIVEELKTRKSGDSDTTVDIKINIHTHEDFPKE